MSVLRRFLGLEEGPESAQRADSASVGAIASRLDELDAGEARYLAGFAYILARVARADFEVSESERGEMHRAVGALGGLAAERAEWVVELACGQAKEVGGTDDYLVTREFRAHTSRDQRIQLIECLFAVAAADGSISNVETETTLAIAEELGFTRQEGLGLRSRWREHLAELRG